MDRINNTSNSDTLLKATDIARRLGISRALAYQLMASGEILTVRIRNKIVRVTEADFQEYINSCRERRCAFPFNAKIGNIERTLPIE